MRSIAVMLALLLAGCSQQDAPRPPLVLEFRNPPDPVALARARIAAVEQHEQALRSKRNKFGRSLCPYGSKTRNKMGQGFKRCRPLGPRIHVDSRAY